MPLSPVASALQTPFGMPHDFNGGIELAESSLYPSRSSVAHSYSSGSLGQMQFDSSSMPSGPLTEVKCIFKAAGHIPEKTFVRHWLRHTW